VKGNKPLPKDHPLHHASKELLAALDFYMKLRENHLGDFSAFEASWREFLRKIERVWSKAQAGMHDRPGWKRFEVEIEDLRKNDPLLRYLRHARNADEHSIQDVTGDWDAKARATQITSNSIKVEWEVWDRPLLPVTNRGVTYEPPREHLGQPLSDRLKKGVAEPIVMADLALGFYKSVLNRAISEVLDSGRG
jgi:hypothetical protein